MTKDPEQKMKDYIDALEGVNQQLVIGLKECLKLLSETQPPGENKATCRTADRSFE